MVVSLSLKGTAARAIHKCTEISRFMSDGSLRSTWGVLRAPAMTTEPLCSMAFMPKRPGASGSGQAWVKPEYFLQLKVRPWGTTQEQLVQFDFTCSFLVPGKTRYMNEPSSKITVLQRYWLLWSIVGFRVSLAIPHLGGRGFPAVLT